jgi:hypothetical protein
MPLSNIRATPEKPTVATINPKMNPVTNLMMLSLSVYVLQIPGKHNTPKDSFGSLLPSQHRTSRQALQISLGIYPMYGFFGIQRTTCDVHG